MKKLLLLIMIVTTSCSNMLQEGLDSKISDGTYGNNNTSIGNNSNNATHNGDNAFSISGRVLHNGEGVSAVSLILSSSDTNQTVTTGSDGFYVFTNIPSGTYVITPEKDSSIYTPDENSIIIEDKGASGVDFTREYITFSVTQGMEKDEVLHRVINTSDGGYIAAGYSTSNNSLKDAYVVKMSAGGTLQWHKVYGDFYDDEAYDIIETTEGYIVAGYTVPSDESVGSDFWVFTIDYQGSLISSQTYGTVYSEAAYSMSKVSDGGFIVAGYAFNEYNNKDAWIVKVSDDLTKEWDRSYGGNNYDTAFDIIQSSDGNFVFTGITRSYSSTGIDAWIVKTDQTGEVIWQNNFGDSADDYAHAIVETSDNGYVLAGSQYVVQNENSDGWIIKVSSEGAKEWDYLYSSDADESFQSMVKINDGFVAVGNSANFSTGSNTFILQIDDSGKEVFQRTYEYSGQQFAYSIIINNYNGFTFVGTTETVENGKDCLVQSIDREGGF